MPGRGNMLERRVAERFRIEAAVEFSVFDRSETAIAYDLSTDGCMLEASNGVVEAGDAVALTFPNGISAEGTIIWTKHRNAGVQFASGMSPVAVERIARDCAPLGLSGEIPTHSARESWRAPARERKHAAAAPPEDREKLVYILHYAFSVTIVAYSAVLLLLR